MLLVAFNHADVSFLPGGYVGVDVFFVLSGFLITGLLIGDAVEHRQVSLSRFYIRRARRILPAATLTLVATAVAAHLLYTAVRAKEVLTDIGWASVFGSNVHFSNVGTDYFEQDRAVSPVRHFWSLAVEEQFYIVWPTVVSVLLIGLHLRRRRTAKAQPLRPVVSSKAVARLAIVTALIVAASLGWSILQTTTNPTAAYFSTFTRGWELGLGALLAILAVRLERLPSSVRFGLGWLGLAAIGVSAVFYTADTPFPGYAALLPTIGASMVIAAGIRDVPQRFAAGTLLSVRPMRYVGDLSYTLYLWHWPVLVLADEKWGDGDALPVGTKIALLGGAFALSVLTFTFFERPIHRGVRPKFLVDRPRIFLWSWGLAPLIVIFAASAARFSADQEILTARVDRYLVEEAELVRERTASRLDQAKAQAAAQRDLRALSSTGALPAVDEAARAAEANRPVPSGLTPAPGTDDFKKFIAPMESKCSPSGSQTKSPICKFGSGTKTLVVFGDSHTQMWLPTIRAFASGLGYNIRPVMKSGCSVPEWGGATDPSPGCRDWYSWAVSEVRRLRPHTILVSAQWMPSGPGSNPGGAYVTAAFAKLLPQLKNVTPRVIVVGDLFGQAKSPSDCLARQGANLGTCSSRFDQGMLSFYRGVQNQSKQLGANFIDTSGWFCARANCPMVVGRTVVYADYDHVTTTYARRLVSPFEAGFKAALAPAPGA